jgi:hypothetical protein
MPRGDGTGPMGSGPMTGRGAGICAGFAVPGYANQVPGAGFARGRGFFGRGGQRGRRNWYYATGLTGWQRAGLGFASVAQMNPYLSQVSPEQEADILKNEAEFLKKQLENIQQRIDNLQESK